MFFVFALLCLLKSMFLKKKKKGITLFFSFMALGVTGIKGQVRSLGTIVPSDRKIDDLGTYDNYYDGYRQEGSPSDESKRAFTYLVLGSARFVYASAGRLAVMKVVSSLSASADVLALASVEVDISAVNPGQSVTVKWRGKPVFIRHRTSEEIQEANAVGVGSLRDPEEDSVRIVKPEW